MELKKKYFKKRKEQNQNSQTKSVREHETFTSLFLLRRGHKECLATLSTAPGVSVYNEVVETLPFPGTETVCEFRVWNPFKSKIGAALLVGLKSFHIRPQTKLLYLGAASGTTVSHCADLVAPRSDNKEEKGVVYAVEFSLTACQLLLGVCANRLNIVPIKADVREPETYRLFLEPVDVVFIDVSQKDQSRILGENCKRFLKDKGHFMMSLKAASIDSTKDPEIVFEEELRKLEKFGFKPEEMVRLEPYEKNHCIIQGVYRNNK